MDLPSDIVVEGMLFDTNGQQVTGLASSVDDMMLCGNAEVDGQPSDKLTPYFTEKCPLHFRFLMQGCGLLKPHISTHSCFAHLY